MLNMEEIMKKNTYKVMFLNKLEESLAFKIIICLTLSFLVILFYLIFNSSINKKNSREYTITSDIKLVNQIEEVYLEGNNFNINGYAFLLDMDSDATKISILLKNVNDGKEVWANVEQISRSDVNSYYNSESNYENSGFYATIKNKKLNTDECYEIIVKLDYLTSTSKSVNKAILTNRYIMNGTLYSYNPYETDQPDMDIDSDLLREVFTNGKLCFNEKDLGVFVYQYNDKLFWITDKDFNFEADGMTYIIYHLYTSQIDKLPEKRIQHSFDNLDFYFEEYEYTDENTAPYRVAIRDIPDTYPITYINTGVYDTDNKQVRWRKQFHLFNDFR